MGRLLERAAKKWKPVFREKARETKESRARCDSTESQRARERGVRPVKSRQRNRSATEPR